MCVLPPTHARRHAAPPDHRVCVCMCVYVSDVCGQEQIPRRAIQHQAHLSLLPIGCRGFLLRSLMCMVVSTYVCVCAFVRVRACALAVIQHSLARLWKVIAPHSSALALSCVSTLLAGGGCRMFGGADWHGKERSRCSGCVVGCSAMQNVPLTVRCGVQRNSTMSTPPRRR